MPINLGTEMVKGLYSKTNRWQGDKVAAPLPPVDNLPWGPMPQINPAYLDPRVTPNNAGFPLPRGPSLPQGGQAPQERSMVPTQEPPIMGPSEPTMQTAAQKRRATVGAPRKPPGALQPAAASITSLPAGDQMLRMMHGERRRQ